MVGTWTTLVVVVWMGIDVTVFRRARREMKTCYAGRSKVRSSSSSSSSWPMLQVVGTQW